MFEGRTKLILVIVIELELELVEEEEEEEERNFFWMSDKETSPSEMLSSSTLHNTNPED